MRTIVYGTGAIGGTVGSWLAQAGVDVTFLARPATAAILNERGVRLRPQGAATDRAATVRVRAIADWREASAPELVVLAVKNYDLEAAAIDVRSHVGDDTIVLGLQNGVANQRILPRYFRRVAYGVVCYNAWRDAPNEFGYQSRGPIVLGVRDDAMRAERDRLVHVLARALTCRAEARIDDAARCKTVVNLANSVTALVGVGVRRIENVDALRRCVASVLDEGVQILRAAGVREVRLGNTPGWRAIRANLELPAPLATWIFRRRLRRLHMSSMGQDVYVQGSASTELDTLNGEVLELAASVGFPAPRNRALYETTREWLQQPDPRPVHESALWARLEGA